jgi:heme-degrading monooxygenase HmoA
MVMIARMWRGWVRTEQANAYVAYITGTGLREYAATPGNLGCQMWTRDLGDGRTEILTVSWWESRDAIIGFAGSDIEAAVFYPEDDEYLVDRETTVSHFEVAAAQAGWKAILDTRVLIAEDLVAAPTPLVLARVECYTRRSAASRHPSRWRGAATSM